MDKGTVAVLMDGIQVGQIAQTKDGLCAFEYDINFLTTGFSISPYALPLRPGLFIAERDPFDGNFGVFDDSLPDGWGSLLLDRFLKEQGRDIGNLTVLERLSLIGANGRGALEYRPDESFLKTAEFADFDRLAQECSKLLEDKETDATTVQRLYTLGGSSGGARSKVFAKIDGREWLVKFKATNDPVNIGEIEYRYSLLAKECGIEMPETCLLQGKYFAVERFDRTLRGKIHTITASGIANAFYRTPSLDYTDLFAICRQLIKDDAQTLQLYRRMVFNVLISNKDDHSKNFAFQYLNGEWRLSPAYDMLPSSGFNGQHTTSIGGKGNPTRDDVMIVARSVGIDGRIAGSVYDEIESKLATEG